MNMKILVFPFNALQMDGAFSEAMQGSSMLAWKGHNRIKLFQWNEAKWKLYVHPSPNQLSRSS